MKQCPPESANRNPKLEIQKPKEIRRSKSESPRSTPARRKSEVGGRILPSARCPLSSALFALFLATIATRAATFTVINTNATGAGSLQQALFDANTNAGPDTIAFNLPPGELTISPDSELPTLVEPVTVDGTTQPGFAGSPVVELNGTGAGGAANGLRINTSNCVVRALVINRFPGHGVEITNAENNRVEGCYLGLDSGGLSDQGNSLNGILLTNAALNTIGGLDPTNRNFISGNNLSGIAIGGAEAVSNSVLGNVIGLNVTNGPTANAADGLRANAPFNLIGGGSSRARNVISGNTGDGIEIGPLGTNTIVRGNYIGTDPTGTQDRGNTANGIYVNDAPGVVIGGATAGEGNLIAGNGGDGLELSGAPSANHLVLGNLIGTDSARSLALPNAGHGIFITSNSRSNVIGGILPGEANTIFFNGADGVSVSSGTNNSIRGNSISANGSTTAELGLDLGPSGVTANDDGDPDTGANQLQNFPILLAATNTATELVVVGSLNSLPGTTYTLDFYSNLATDPSGNGEGQFYIGSTNVTTDATSNVTFLVALSATLQGRHLTATATDPFGNTSEFAASVAVVSLAPGLTFTVLNTNDSGSGSLRDAIQKANAAVTTGDRIEFAITNLTTTISPASALPAITDPVTIDGYTQPGSAASTSATTFDGTVLVRLAGNLAGAGANGLTITVGGCTVRGLMITGFTGSGGDGIEISGGGTNVIEGCLIGIDAAGADQGNGGNGILISGSPDNVIGGSSPGARNVISGNSSEGIEISGAAATGNQILGNLIGPDQTGTLDVGNSGGGIIFTSAGNNTIGGASAGAGNLISGNTFNGVEFSGASATNNRVLGNRIGTEVTGTTALANTTHGVFITTSSHGNRIGGVLAGEGNTIAFNGQDGINVANAAANTNNTFRGNSIFANGTTATELGIDLGPDGINANDEGDPDTGANQLQNFPVLSSVTNSVAETTFSGSLNSQPDTTYTIDFYADLASDIAGSGEGQFFLGSTNLATAADGNLNFTISLPVAALPARFITATATDPFGNTSEFAANVFAFSTAPGLTHTVLNTNDSGPGSLRQAILDANAAINAGDTIAFAITKLATTISPASALPTIIDPVTIDGYTQPGAAPNTSSDAFNGTLLVTLNGTSAGSGADGLKFISGHNTVRGLVIINFAGATGDGLEFKGGGTNLVAGNLIGVDPDGADRGNGGDGVRLVESPGNLVGGEAPGARNVISGNQSDGLEIKGSGSSNNVVQGNLIGLTPAGTVARGNSGNGVLVGAANNLLGGPNAASRNVISGNSSDGVEVTGVSRNRIFGNYLGTDVTGAFDLGNSANGVLLNFAPSNTVGSAVAGTGNLISGNNLAGVAISGASSVGNVVQGNFIGTDGGGSLVVGNGGDGVLIASAGNNTIGGATAAEGNLISGNGGNGAELNSATAAHNVLRNNLIGTDRTGTLPLGNAGNGILIQTSAHDNVIGGSGNIIAHNALDGIALTGGTNNSLHANRIFGNGDLGIDLGANGVTANDLGDSDTGANQLQNFPVLTGATNTVLSADIAGSLDSFANATFTIEFFVNPTDEPGGSGEGQAFLGSTNVTTDAAGHVDFVASLPTSLTGRYVTATATDNFGNTSEFGPNVFATSTVPGLTLIVTNTSDSGAGSLREAMTQANAAITAGDTITFNLPDSGTKTIAPLSALPAITDPVVIDGYSQPGASANTLTNGHNAVVLIRLDGASAGAGADGLRISARDCRVQGLAIGGFSGDGIEINTGTGNLVRGCYLGLDPDGTTRRGNTGNGVLVTGTASQTLIGGGNVAERCVISANHRGVRMDSVSLNTVQGCCLGTDATGTLARGNTNSGVLISGSSARGNLIGGAVATERNVISGNGVGATSEGHGVTLLACLSNSVLGNYIGTTATGSAAQGNQDDGIKLSNGASTNFIGGTLPGAGNVISANAIGIDFSNDSPDQNGNIVQGNLIGTDAAGLNDLGNTSHGLSFSFADFNQIGGPTAGARNVISGNNGNGVNVNCCAAVSNIFEGNFVGVDLTGTNALPNGGAGFFIGSGGNRIGGEAPGAGNVIAHNSGDGILHFINSALHVAILGNHIYANGGLGIDLGLDSTPTPNDPGDTDTGANNLQNFPVLTRVAIYPTETVIEGTLQSLANQDYRIELFNNAVADASGFGEGQTYRGFTNATTDAVGNAVFAFIYPAALVTNQCVTATATDPDNNTSEFSACFRAARFDTLDLALDLTESADLVSTTTNFSYSIFVTNHGPTNATSVLVSNVLPATVSFVSATPSQGACSNLAGTVICDLGSLTNGGTASVVVEVIAIATGNLNASASVSSAEPENLPANNSDAVVAFAGVADVGVTRLAGPNPIAAGQVLTNIVTVTNRGPDTATQVALDYFVNGAMVPASVTASQGTVTESGNNVAAQLGSIPAGGSAVVTVLSVPTSAGAFNDFGSLSRLERDPTAMNNSVNSFVTVTNGSGVVQFQTLTLGGAEANGPVTVAVQRTGGTAGDVTVDFTTANGTALAGADFTATNGTLTFSNGVDLLTFEVWLRDDFDPECNETFTVSLSHPTGGAVLVGRTNLVISIFDNELTDSGNITLASAATANPPPTTSFGASQKPDLSYDGRYVVFYSDSEGLVTNAFLNYRTDVFVFDFLTRQSSLVSVNASPDGVGANGNSYDPLLSRDGRHVLFYSEATDLVAGDTNGYFDLFVRDLDAGVTTLVSQPTGGGGADNATTYFEPFGSLLSSNGNVIVFASDAANLAANDNNGSFRDVFARDVAAGTTVLISADVAGTGSGDDNSDGASVSGDGRYVVFESWAANLTALLDENASADVFRRDLWSNVTELVSVDLAGTGAGDAGAELPLVSHDGRFVAFQSSATDLTTNGGNGLGQVYLRDLTDGVTRLVTVATNGELADGSCALKKMSADGRFILFESAAANLLTNEAASAYGLFVRDTVAATTVAVNWDTNGSLSGEFSEARGLSDDGRYVLLHSAAANFAPDDNNGTQDVFVRDLLNSTTTLLSRGYAGGNSAASESFEAALSGDGGTAAFTSDADDIVSRDVNFDVDVFVRRLASAPNVLASAGTGASANDVSFNPVISADGTQLAFASYANNLTPEFNLLLTANIFVRHLTANTTTLVSVSTNGALADGDCESPQISADNRFVLFTSRAKNLAPGDSNGEADVFLRDLVAGTTMLVGVNLNDTGSGNAGTYDAKMSPDARFIVFESGATNFAANDVNGSKCDIFIRNRTNATAEMISVNAVGTGSANDGSYDPVLSEDGRYVAFESDATDLGPTDGNDASDVYVRDRLGGSNVLVSVNLAGSGPGNGGSYAPVISADGRFVAFSSEASDLVAGDTNGEADIFIRDLQLNTTALVSVKSSGGGPGNGGSSRHSVTPDGRFVIFQSAADDLVPNDGNGCDDVFVRDVLAGTTTLISLNCDGTGTGNSDSYFWDYDYPHLTPDGCYVTFHSKANNLVPGSHDSSGNVFRRDLLTGTTVLVSQNRFTTGSGLLGSWEATISANGNVIGFASSAPDLVALDLNEIDDVFTWSPAAIAGLPDLVLNKSVSVASIVAGNDLTYTLTVTNVGSASASAVSLTDTLPAAMSFVSATTSQGTVNNSAGTVTANLGSLGLGAGASLTITVTAVGAGDTTNTASAASSGADANPANNISSATVLVIPLTPPPLSVTSSNSSLVISWPSSTPAGFALETTTNLTPVITWNSVTNSVSDDGTNRSVTITPDTGEPARFYQLRY